MSNKTLKVLVGIFLVLVAAASYPLWGKQVSKLINSKVASNTEIDFAAFTARSVNEVIISETAGEDKEEKKLTKSGDKWKIDSFDASQKEVDEFFDQLQKLKAESLVSKNKDNHKTYGVTQDTGTLLSFVQGTQTSAFVISQGGDGTGRFYAKKENSDNVYSVSGGSISTKLSQNVLAWRDKVLADIPRADFQRLEIIANSTVRTITKNQESKLEVDVAGQKQVLDESGADKIFMALNALTADDFLNEAEIAEFQKIKDKTIVRLLREHGDPREIQLVKRDANWWAQVTGKEVYYKLSESRLVGIIN